MFKDFNLNRFKNMKPPSDNSFTTMQEVKQLSKIPLNKSNVKKFDNIEKTFSSIAAKNNITNYNPKLVSDLIKKYNGVEGKHGLYNFVDGLKVVSAGERDPDSEGVEGMSASKMRKAATKDDFQEFITGLPVGFTYSQELFDAVKEGMALPGDEEISAYRANKNK